ncbi:MAG: TadE/TadG family type IV pilus assembly protein [Terriglobia bacterium]
MLSCLSVSNPWETATKGIDIRTEQCPRTSSEGGLELVEFALLLPILLTLVTGMLTCAMAFQNYMELTDAVGVGARALAISRGNTTDPCNTTAQAVYNAAPTLKSTSITLTFSLNGTPYSGATCSSTSTTTGAAGNLVQGASAQVTATYPYSLSIYGIKASSGNLTAQTTEIVQ